MEGKSELPKHSHRWGKKHPTSLSSASTFDLAIHSVSITQWSQLQNSVTSWNCSFKVLANLNSDFKLSVSLKKNGEQMIAGMFFMKSSSQATRWTLKDAPRCLYPKTISECLLFTLLEWKLFNHCLSICFNLETVNLLAHNVPGASPHLTMGQLEPI